jgi:hypothetical protein
VVQEEANQRGRSKLEHEMSVMRDNRQALLRFCQYVYKERYYSILKSVILLVTQQEIAMDFN